MLKSTLTNKGQTTVPKKLREALGIKLRERLQWDIRGNGTVTIKPEPSALELFASMKSDAAFPVIQEEKAAVRKIIANEVAREGLEPSK